MAFIERLALTKPRPSLATLHRLAVTDARQRDAPVPGLFDIRDIVLALDPPLVTLALEGPASYRDRHELVYRRRAERPNQTLQADHTELDILIIGADGKPDRPWLTTVVDAYCRDLVVGMKPVREDDRVNSTIVLVRAATLADLHDAAHIIANHRGEKSSDWVERFTVDLADADRLFLVATIADDVVGFGQARVIPVAAGSTTAPPAGWYLSGMTVPAFLRRLGIGSALIEARLQWMAQRTSTVHYLADPANLATISLHARFGFAMTHRVALESENVQLDHYQLDLTRR